MNNFGFIKVASAIPQVEVANCKFNVQRIEALIKQAAEKQVQIICFPELCITGYTCGDLFHQDLLLDEAEKQVLQLIENTAHLPVVVIVGMPVRCQNALYNAAVAFQQGEILAVVPKTYINQREQPCFTSGNILPSEYVNIGGKQLPFGKNKLFQSKKVCFAIEIGDDLFVPASPSISHALLGATVIFNPSAVYELVGKNDYLRQLITQKSAQYMAAYIHASAGFGESTTDMVFAGNAYIAENGNILAASERFSFSEQLVVSEIDVEKLIAERQRNSNFIVNSRDTTKQLSYLTEFNLTNCQLKELSRNISCYPFVPAEEEMTERCSEVINIQISSLATRLKRTGLKTVTIGISGGLDSTLALLACVRTFDKLNIPRKQIIGITMPGFGTTGKTYNNAVNLMQQLGISMREISIKDACLQHFKDIGHDENNHDAVYENAQARERMQILMDVANQTGGLVIGTGDLSELALGWATYNGDHISMYAVNADIPKTLIKHLIQWISLSENEDIRKILSDVIETPVSPELLPAKDGQITQKTEDLVGPYELHDFFLYYAIRFGFRPAKIHWLAMQAFENRYNSNTIKKWMTIFFHRFFNQQFKRSCLPDGPRVGSVCLSPRGTWHMPSDANSEIWLKEIAEIE